MAIDPRLVQALHLRTVRHAALRDELAAHVEAVRARSVPAQRPPYPTLAEAAASQCQFTLGPAEGGR